MNSHKKTKEIIIFICFLCFLSIFSFVGAQEELEDVSLGSKAGLNLIETGDVLDIKVGRNKELNRVLRVGGDGNIDFPLIGTVEVSGKTRDQLQADITEMLSLYIKSPSVKVYLPGYRRKGEGIVLGPEEGAIPLVTRVVTLAYGDATRLKTALAGTVSKVGKVEADKTSNSLIITDLAHNIEEVVRVVEELDVLAPEERQVLIEAQMVEVVATNNEELGVEWFVDRVTHKEFGGSFDHKIYFPPRPTEIRDVFTGSSATDTEEQRLEIPNVGLSTLERGGSFFFGKVLRSYDVNAVINALSATSKAKVLARPRIVVANNNTAKMEILSRIPYRELVQSVTVGQPGETFTTAFLDVGVTLKVTPRIKRGDIVNMELEPEVSFIQGESSFGVPIKVSRKTTTEVNIKDNNTLVIGGLLQDRKITTKRKVPILGDIPLIGRLFRNEKVDTEKTELLVFITPHILEGEKARDITDEGLLKAKQIERQE